MTLVLKLAPIPDPWRYEGLFIYDFGDHAAVGYTPAEILVLRQSADHRHGTPYQIYRVDERGALELRGAADAELVARDALCFARFEAAMARKDFSAILAAAGREALPTFASLRLMRCYGFDPPDVTVLEFPASAGPAVSRWLTATGLHPGDRVEGGAAALSLVESAGGLTLASEVLPCGMPPDRPAEVVLATTHLPLQR